MAENDLHGLQQKKHLTKSSLWVLRTISFQEFRSLLRNCPVVDKALRTESLPCGTGPVRQDRGTRYPWQASCRSLCIWEQRPSHWHSGSSRLWGNRNEVLWGGSIPRTIIPAIRGSSPQAGCYRKFNLSNSYFSIAQDVDHGMPFMCVLAVDVREGYYYKDVSGYYDKDMDGCTPGQGPFDECRFGLPTFAAESFGYLGQIG